MSDTTRHLRDTCPPGGLALRHYGAAAWAVTDGRRVVLLDPYFTRLRYAGKRFGMATAPFCAVDARPAWTFDQTVPSDTATIDAQVDVADFIVISHAHFNHCMDMPYIARKTGALVIGSESATNVARIGGVDDQQLLPIKGGEDYAFDDLSIRVIPSLHSALGEKRYFDPGTIPRDAKAPLRLKDYIEGGTFAYLIRTGRHEVLLFGSMNYIEREIQGLRPTMVLIAAARPRLQIHDYTGRLLRAAGEPPVVVATHWDIQTFPYGANQDTALEQARTFVAEVRAASPQARVLLPRHFDTIRVDETGQVLEPPV